MKSKTLNSNSKNTGVLLISHGSRLPESSETINKLADMYREHTDFKVGICYMELREPNIPKAMDNLVKNTEIEKVIVVPVFLANGMHTTRDIPKILRLIDDVDEHDHTNENHEEHGDNHSHHDHHHDFEKINFDGEIIFTEPLGADPLVVEIIKKRVDNALN
ncbi:sirohydrochlorin cobaltochelatase [Methanobrevibacter cuticularis]|uniref:Sirohydrochlorin cobaltochelatase n=1 Tax=Methanobrevibacter cuticularis TaxID=47311 RepID=A0A166CKI8_9EURY|nr:sirohydrochlorin nickelochelatase [Methanobrevibacter cuticularis]KZX14605.1 sirohydrochlorin cobaltochelatase [Methanobrevibacter cuticularis]